MAGYVPKEDSQDARSIWRHQVKIGSRMMAMEHTFQMRTRIGRDSQADDIIGGGKRRPWGIEWSCHLYHAADSPEIE